jgi:GTP cyclohydrolase I
MGERVQLPEVVRASSSESEQPHILLMHHVESILDIIAPNWSELEHMRETPRRFANQLHELTTPVDFTFTIFPASSDEMVVLGPIPFFTLCAHHVIPFYGNAFVGYVPNNFIAGLSKFVRLVKNMSRGLWVQEELTGAIADGIESNLDPRGTAVILEGEHMCTDAGHHHYYVIDAWRVRGS